MIGIHYFPFILPGRSHITFFFTNTLAYVAECKYNALRGFASSFWRIQILQTIFRGGASFTADSIIDFRYSTLAGVPIDMDITVVIVIYTYIYGSASIGVPHVS